jgi:hypothetical protein
MPSPYDNHPLMSPFGEAAGRHAAQGAVQEADVLVVPHNGGMNSQTWWVGEDYVAKSVPAARTSAFVAGLRVATTLEAAGIPAGAPVLTHTGETLCWYGENPLALLRRVRGLELTKSAARLIGSTLGRVHLALADLPGEEPFDWLSPDRTSTYAAGCAR